MKLLAFFNQYGDCINIISGAHDLDGGVEVPPGTLPESIWLNSDTGEVQSREPCPVEFKSAYSVGEEIDFTTPNGSVALVHGEKVTGVRAFDAPQRLALEVVGKFYLSQRIEIRSYAEERRAAYPSIADQLDKIYHEGVDAWRADIQAVKEQFPKPGE